MIKKNPIESFIINLPHLPSPDDAFKFLNRQHEIMVKNSGGCNDWLRSPVHNIFPLYITDQWCIFVLHHASHA